MVFDRITKQYLVPQLPPMPQYRDFIIWRAVDLDEARIAYTLAMNAWVKVCEPLTRGKDEESLS